MALSLLLYHRCRRHRNRRRLPPLTSPTTLSTSNLEGGVMMHPPEIERVSTNLSDASLEKLRVMHFHREVDGDASLEQPRVIVMHFRNWAPRHGDASPE